MTVMLDVTILWALHLKKKQNKRSVSSIIAFLFFFALENDSLYRMLWRKWRCDQIGSCACPTSEMCSCVCSTSGVVVMCKYYVRSCGHRFLFWLNVLLDDIQVKAVLLYVYTFCLFRAIWSFLQGVECYPCWKSCGDL